jgi:uncharacterized protein YjbJ (UPF0337 family)
MDTDRMKGKVDEVAGRAKRQAGEWTGDTESQVKGGAQEVKGKVQNAWGKTKDAVRDATDNATHQHHDDREIHDDRRKERKEDVA